jgi:hypothetical protein
MEESLMLPTTHPLAKTATELRRGINRLHVFKEQQPNDEAVVNGAVDRTIQELKEARRHIDKQYWDTDLTDE